MTDQVGKDKGEWPVRCPACGTGMASAVIDFDPDNDTRAELNPGEMVAVDYCPNPECPLKRAGESGPADAATP